MSHFINYKQINKTYSNQKQKEKKRKSNINQKLHYLNKQILALKSLHKNILKMITKVSLFIPEEIANLFNMICGQNSKENQFINDKRMQRHANLNHKIVSQSHLEKKETQLKIQDLKYKDTAIKNEISQELKVLKFLQSKEKELRVENQKQGKLRRSLSKQSIFKNCLKQISNLPKQNKQSIRIHTVSNNHHHQEIKTYIESKDHSLQNSPKFGLLNEYKTGQSFQSFKISRQFNPQPLKVNIDKLFCSNKHEYYKGQLLNNVPNGKGALIVCCQQIPIKINAKTLRYYGNFENGAFEGKGVLFCKGNIKFQGIFVKGKRNGEGVINLDGKSEKGVWQNDKLISFI